MLVSHSRILGTVGANLLMYRLVSYLINGDLIPHCRPYDAA